MGPSPCQACALSWNHDHFSVAMSLQLVRQHGGRCIGKGHSSLLFLFSRTLGTTTAAVCVDPQRLNLPPLSKNLVCWTPLWERNSIKAGPCLKRSCLMPPAYDTGTTQAETKAESEPKMLMGKLLPNRHRLRNVEP